MNSESEKPKESLLRRDWTNDDEHLRWLQEPARVALTGTTDAKVKVVYADKFIVHDGAKRILSSLKQALQRPETERPPCFLVVGPSNIGKTALLNRLYRDFGGDPASGAIGVHDKVPILLVKLPSRPTDPRVHMAMARSLLLPVIDSRVGGKVGDLVLRRMKERMVRMIVLSQFNHIEALSKNERKVVYDLVQNISDEGISVVAVGTDISMVLVREEPELVTRLRPLRMNGFSKRDKGFVDFLGTLETYYPFSSPSRLGIDHVAEIFDITNGIIGEIVMLVNAAAEWALRNDRLTITSEAFKECTYLRPLGDASSSQG